MHAMSLYMYACSVCVSMQNYLANKFLNIVCDVAIIPKSFLRNQERKIMNKINLKTFYDRFMSEA